MRFVIGTRGSKLALAQAEYVQQKLQERYPEDEFELRIIKTKGDKIQNKSLAAIGDKGLFVKEIERELLDGEIQLAVHSMKDMPGEIPDELCFADAWEREDPRDVLILREAKSMNDLPEGSTIGTGSKRRAFQLLALRADLNIVDIRGNVDTRLNKMHEQKLDGIVLAAAGLKRLHMESVITQYLSTEEMIPAAAQGTLAIELRREDCELLSMVNAFSDEKAQRIAQTEREFLQRIGGDCHLPIGAYASVLADGQIRLQALFGDADGEHLAKCDVCGNEPKSLAAAAVRQIRVCRAQI